MTLDASLHILAAMETRSFQSIREELGRRRGQWRQCAIDLEVDYSTILRIVRGNTPSPRIDTVDAIYNWLNENPPKKRMPPSQQAAA